MIEAMRETFAPWKRALDSLSWDKVSNTEIIHSLVKKPPISFNAALSDSLNCSFKSSKPGFMASNSSDQKLVNRQVSRGGEKSDVLQQDLVQLGLESVGRVQDYSLSVVLLESSSQKSSAEWLAVVTDSLYFLQEGVIDEELIVQVKGRLLTDITEVCSQGMQQCLEKVCVLTEIGVQEQEELVEALTHKRSQLMNVVIVEIRSLLRDCLTEERRSDGDKDIEDGIVQVDIVTTDLAQQQVQQIGDVDSVDREIDHESGDFGELLQSHYDTMTRVDKLVCQRLIRYFSGFTSQSPEANLTKAAAAKRPNKSNRFTSKALPIPVFQKLRIAGMNSMALLSFSKTIGSILAKMVEAVSIVCGANFSVHHSKMNFMESFLKKQFELSANLIMVESRALSLSLDCGEYTVKLTSAPGKNCFM
ncbi:hypothetical protein WICPIJ_003850 [Wickerhamomyces pijperi]|uniref:Uncharacterized protein n=1 Tax=Wickerhamomyces pijperi TaxID=599730 RepID=A0A9P8TNH6_WICPI|nr:hypothetical protein WICPIJ_003850 [Wickerhamomyces pijperi]